MTLVEMLMALAVVLILISATVRLGSYVKTRSSIQLAQSALGVLETALQMYYENFAAFPFRTNVADTNGNGLLDEYVGAYAVVQGIVPNNDPDFDSSSALFYFLDRHPDSRSIAGSLVGGLITNKDANGTPLVVQIPSGSLNRDLVRFIDPWGVSFRYAYEMFDTFPRLSSAGPDGRFGTDDDIQNQ